MAFKTNLTLNYINQYLQQKNIEVPKELNLESIFKEFDKYDEDGNEVKNGDGILQTAEVGDFLKKVGEFSSKVRHAVFDCYQEVREKQKQEEAEAMQEKLKNPPKAYDDNGISEEAMDYIFDKLASLGFGIEKVDLDELIDIISRFDYDLDPNQDSKITKKEADDFYSNDYANKYMNKDKNGKSVDTHVLDWIVNNYLEKTKPSAGI